MIPYFVFDHFNIGPIKLYTWGFFVGLAFASGYFLTLWQARRRGIDQVKIVILSVVIFLGAALGSRVLFLLQNPAAWLADVSLLWRIEQGGLMIWGGILGAILFGWLFVKFSPPHPPPLLNKERVGVRYSFWYFADLLTPAIALGIGIGRLGCFLINDHLGAPTNLPWGILWPNGIVRYPVALYESLAGFGLFAILIIIQSKLSLRARLRSSAAARSNPEILQPSTGLPRSSAIADSLAMTDGFLFLLFLVSYSILRFFLDFLRASQGILADPRWWGLTSSQWISVFVFLIVIILIIRKRRSVTASVF